MKNNFHVKLIACMIITLVSCISYAADTIEKPCNEQDIAGGAWELFSSRRLISGPVDYLDLLQPYQYLVFGKDTSYRRITLNRQIDLNEVSKLLEVIPRENFKLENGIVTIMDSVGKPLRQVQCRYYTDDLENTEIKKGTMSILWFMNDKPIIVQAFRRISNKPSNKKDTLDLKPVR